MSFHRCLSAIAQHCCPGLETLILEGCNVTDFGVQTLGRAQRDYGWDTIEDNLGSTVHDGEGWLQTRPPLPHGLRCVRLGGMKRVTDVSVIDFCRSRGTRHLHTLDVTGCDITDGSVVALATHCHFLRTLDVALCGAITDAALLALATSPCRRTLQHIDTGWCMMLTDMGEE